MKKVTLFLMSCIIIVFFFSCQKHKTEGQKNLDNEYNNGKDDTSLKQRSFGCNLLPDAEYSKIPSVSETNAARSQRTAVLYSCPPIKDQGSEGSCVAFATAYSARSIYWRNHWGGEWNYNSNIFSPEYVFNQIKVGQCVGSQVIQALLLMKNTNVGAGGGVCTWNQMPYSSLNGCNIQPTNLQKGQALRYTISNYYTVQRNTNAIKAILASGSWGPVIVAGPVDQNFLALRQNQVYMGYNSNRFVGNHCYSIVGYDDAKHAFKIQNSWGTSWGTGGFGWIDYNAVNPTFFREAYVIKN